MGVDSPLLVGCCVHDVARWPCTQDMTRSHDHLVPINTQIVDGGVVVITSFDLALACGVSTDSAAANVFISDDGRLTLREASVDPWNLPTQAPTPAPAAAPTPEPAVAPTRPPRPTPVKGAFRPAPAPAPLVPGVQVCQNGVYVPAIPRTIVALCVALVPASIAAFHMHWSSPAMASSRNTTPRPFCRIYTENLACCSKQGLVTPRTFASMVVVCSEFVVVPNESCISVDGPPDASVKFTDFGTYLEARRFLVDWSNSDGYEGDVRITINQCVVSGDAACTKHACQGSVACICTFSLT